MRTTSRVLALLLPLMMSGCAGLFFHPSKEADPRLEPAVRGAGLSYEAAHFRSGDGTPLSGLFFPSTAPANGTVVHFHGNAENMTTHALFVAWLAKERYNVFVFDYRGYGDSGGKPSMAGSVEDGVAALRYLSSRADVDPDRVIVLGQSLGAAVAVTATAKSGLGGVKAVVLESAFSSYRSIARRKLGSLWLTWSLQYPLSFLFPDSQSPRRFIKNIAPRPILFIHGDADPVVPFREGQALFEAAGEPKTFWKIAGGGHTAAFQRASPYSAEFRPRLVRFLDEALK